MSMDWTKLLATVFAAALLALQGVNVHQGGMIERTEEKIIQLQSETEKEIRELHQLFFPIRDAIKDSIGRQQRMEAMLNKLCNTTPTPTDK